MVKSTEEILAAIRDRIGDDDSDEAIGLMEDVSDTLNSLVDPEDWKTKYEENDKAWRTKYRDRFMGKGGKKEEDPEEEPENNDKKTFTYEELFTTKEEK